MQFLKGLLITIQFFTAIPIRSELPMDQHHLRKAVQAFPLLGLLQGVFYSLFLYLLLEFTPFTHLAAAFLLWLAVILFTGGIHLDGWMDASDAFFSYQGREKRLEIMKDPRIGAFGVLSLIILLSCRFFFIFEFTEIIRLDTYVLITAIPFFSKSVMGGLLLTVKPAKKEGLGYWFQSSASPASLWIYPIYLLAFFLLVGYFFRNQLLPIGILFTAAAVCFIFCRKKTDAWFGGITGDVIGASVEGTELILWLTVWLLHYFVLA
ncbi:adenosylcobinamide-GDP ribazoletransferase [Bacillus sp. BRMEA1]|uniref:adenosylcobinamide-GDP ribazoletransferase n=1 Tax=Neobacillus endophyticus TaxID=2738405 RepID=UPI0015663CB8|nr:adenosylcobinamide-GDP ribazoletransferase [Neobacillus endophyticus]NRD79318.1 adenosylcobinamide-GDP ribazoletransferase [Neobacillus endophyticus]